MENVITQLNTGITADTLWTAVSSVMPFVITVTLFSFGFFIIRRVLKKVRTGKSGI